MQKIFTLFTLLLLVKITDAQVTAPVVIISDKLCKIFVDGTQQAIADDNTPVTLKLTLGEHLIQAKKDEKTLTQTVNLPDEKQKVVTFTFAGGTDKPTEIIPEKNKNEILILNTDAVLGSGLTDNPTEFREVFVFDKGDKINMKVSMKEEKGTNNFFLVSYPTGRNILSRQSVKGIDEQVEILEKGIYQLVINTNFIFDRNISVNVKRIADPQSSNDFITKPLVRQDTIFTKLSVLKNVISSSGFIQPIVLPAKTEFWCYWIGIGDDANVKFETYSEVYAEGKRGNEGDLLYAYGTNRKESLPILTSQRVITYRFADDENKGLFLNRQPYKYYTFKYGTDITSDYAVVNNVPKQLNVLVDVNGQKGQTVYLRVGAFSVNRSYDLPK